LEKDNKSLDTPAATRDGTDKGKTNLAQLLSDEFGDDSLLQTGQDMYYPDGLAYPNPVTLA